MNAAQRLREWLNARYSIQEYALALRVGRRCASLEAFHPQVGRFALLTACNPGGELQDEKANCAANAALAREFDRLGHGTISGLNSAPDGAWPEPSWLIPDLAPATLDALAQRFGQAAALYWPRGRAVRMRVYRSDWRAAAHAAHVDTRFIDWVACAPR